MALVNSKYHKNKWYLNGHLETILPGLFRKVDGVHYTRERIDTPDDDFLDLDWIKNNTTKLVIISHGLEGSSDRPYMKGMAKVFANNDYDVLAWNFRGCGGQVNKQVRFYHSGATQDLDTVVKHAINLGYETIHLIGFSLGGNLTLKYIGESKDRLPKEVVNAVTFSVPLNLSGSSMEISKVNNILYSIRFLRNLKKKIKEKAALMPGQLNLAPLSKIKTLVDFDDHYTAPLHGYQHALDYYEQCSAVHFLKDIKIPTLIVNALNDSFLSPDCYPTDKLKNHPNVHLETPARGGHCGFPGQDEKGYYWSERRALAFLVHNSPPSQ